MKHQVKAALMALHLHSSNLKKKLNEMGKVEALLHFFWLLGPFILLLERSPADAWLSLIGITFLVRSFVRKDFTWLRFFWVQTIFIFWFCTILCSLLAPNSTVALSEALIWFRFPLFAIATVFWLGKDRSFLYAMLLAMTIGVAAMCCILTAELIIEGTKGNRLTWPYGDPVPGNYLAKVGLPPFIVITSIILSGKYQISRLLLPILIFIILITFMTGERMNLIILVCSGLLAAVITAKSIKSLAYIIVGCFISLGLLILNRLPYLFGIINDIPLGPKSDYFNLFSSGLAVWKTSPIFGIGPGNYRYLCADILSPITSLEYVTRCSNHPHNYYIQMLAETGLVGLLFGILMITTFLTQGIQATLSRSNNEVIRTAFIIPLALFFPIASNADFFGQWNNVFAWSALAISMAMVSQSTKPGERSK